MHTSSESMSPSDSDFATLMPADSIKVRKAYQKALDFAFDRKNGIHNLGITGSLGSGKTSIIQSYLKSKEMQWIGVSLADFCETEKEGKDNLSHKLQQKILLQLMANIPHGYPIIRIFCALCLLIVGVILWQHWIGFPRPVSATLICIVQLVANDLLWAWIATAIIIVFISAICWMAVSILQDIHYKIKFKFLEQLDVDIENIRSQDEFDKYLKFLLKYFNHIGTRIVLIEDVDRFGKIDIFMKLRELNKLLNDALEDDVIFIYVMKETVFSDSLEKSKFFDFIVPILPEAYEINGEGILQTKINNILRDLPQIDNMDTEMESCRSLIRYIALYIRDYRLLNNICNEFKVYAEIHSIRMKNEISEKSTFHYYALLAVVLYKNFYPHDFEDTYHCKGVLSNIFLYRHDNALKLQKQMIKESQTLGKKIQKNYVDVRKKITAWKETVLDKLDLPPKNYKIDIAEIYAHHWQEFLDGDMTSVHRDALAILSGWDTTEFLLSDTNEIVAQARFCNLDIGANLKNELSAILEKIKLCEMMHSRAGQIHASALRVTSMTLRQQLQVQGSFQIMLGDLKKDKRLNGLDVGPFVKMLLMGPREAAGSFLDESYRHYLSVFQKGGISENDIFFLTAVQTHQKLPYLYKLDDPSRIIDQIRPDECASEAMWNKSMLDYLLENYTYSHYDPYLSSIMNMLLEHCIIDDSMLWEFFQNETDEKCQFFFSRLRSMNSSLSFLFGDNAHVPIAHRVEYLKTVVMSPLLSDYGDFWINFNIMVPAILIEFDWKNTEFRSRFTHYMEKADLKWPSVDEVKQKTKDYPQEKRQTLLHVISSHEEAKV